MERNGIHIIDLQKTVVKLDEAAAAMKQIAKSGRKILFVATKKQAKELVASRVKQINMPYVTERWPGGMLTNFPTIRKAVKKMASIDKMATDGTFSTLSKRERLQITRQRAKLEKNLGSIADLTRLPAALFVVDISKEYIAVREASRLNIPVFGMVDTNSDPNTVDFPIPANDDAAKSISLVTDVVCKAIEEGLQERKLEREKEAAAKDKKGEKKLDVVDELELTDTNGAFEDAEIDEDVSLVQSDLDDEILEETAEKLTEKVAEEKMSAARKASSKKSNDEEK